MTSPPPVPRVTTKLLHSPAEFHAISEEWKDLFLRSPDASPIQHPSWLLSWIEAFTPHDLVGIEVRQGSRLIGFAPLLIYSRDGERVLAFAGGGVSDYLNLVAEPETEQLVIEQVLDAVQSIPNWTVLDLTDLFGNSALLHSALGREHTQKHDVCYVLSLPQDAEHLVETLTKRQWSNLRNARSRTKREAEATIDRASAATLSEFLNDLVRLHTIRWNELDQNGVLSDSRLLNFHRRVASALLQDAMLRLYRMRLNDRTVAAIYAFFHRETVFCYLQGFDPQFAHLSPGTQLMFAVIEDAVRLGMRRFDFLRGEEGYKLHWRPHGEPTFRIEVPRQRLVKQLVSIAA
ncbi:MAG TPA: GNAT family N-acetyltransferase [Terriglobales bacterium]|nr:GNAT family N-acetyltransferase [Terriglobales bacterium]